MKSYVFPAVAALLIIGTGFVHAYWQGTFGGVDDEATLKRFASHLPNVPPSVGDWQGEEAPEMDEREREVAGADAAVSRIYRDQLNNQVVSLFLVSGRFRNVAQHTPDQCYVAAGFQMMNQEIQYTVETDAGPVQCYTTVFKKDEHMGTQYLRVFWTWSYDGKWIAPDLPRVALVGQPALYKMYFITDVPQPGQAIEQNAAVEFMRKFIPALNPVLFPDAPAGEAAPAEAAAAPAG